MKSWMIFAILAAQLCNAGTWTQTQLDSVFATLYSEGSVAATQEVNNYGVSAYDFGMDLHEMGLTDEAIAWYNALTLGTENPQSFMVGKAWVQMRSGKLQDAMITANAVTSTPSADSLARARAHYLLGIIYFETGNMGNARVEVLASHDLYEELGLDGGIRLCLPFLSSKKQAEIIPPFPVEPPRDDTDS